MGGDLNLGLNLLKHHRYGAFQQSAKHTMNFTGQLNRRTVNIGGGLRQNRNQLLQQAQKERERRQKEKKRETAVLAVQRRVKRHIELAHFRDTLAQEWTEENIAEVPYNSRVFWFTTFYSQTYKRNTRRHQQLDLLLSFLDVSSTSPTNQKRLVDTVAKTVPQLDIHNDADLQSLAQLLKIADRLPPQHSSVIPPLKEIADKLVADADYSVLPQIIQVVDKHASLETLNYLDFLTSTWLLGYPNFHINFKAINQGLTTGLGLHGGVDKKLEILIGLVGMIDVLDRESLAVIAHIVSSIDVPLLTKEECEKEEEEDEHAFRPNQKIISDTVNESLKALYSREFITRASQVMKDDPLYQVLFSSLLVMKPTLKSTFLIYMIPNVFGPLFQLVSSHEVFQKFEQLSDDELFSLSTQFNESVFVTHSDFIKHELYLFLELLQYRLILSNDFELFGDEFPLSKFPSLARFLKNFVFNLIWNAKKIPSRHTHLVNLATKVLSQVYLKDSRLKTLSAGTWTIPRLEVDRLTNTIIEYDQQKDNFDSDNEDKFIQHLAQDSQSKLMIYLKAPFFIPFSKRIQIFRNLIENDRKKLGLDTAMMPFMMGPMSRRQNATIRREHLVEDAYENFNRIGQSFKSQLYIVFTNEYGREEGIDGGGITKEFLTSVVKEGFDGIFVENWKHELYPDPEIGLKYQRRIDSEFQLQRLGLTNFMGKVIGKCLYEGVLVDVSFATFFLTKFNTGYKNSFDDLQSLDKDLYDNLVKLLELSDEELGALNLTFSVDERIDKKTVTVDLIPKGSTTPVTSSNRLKFIHEMSNYKLNKLINLQSTSFLNGLYEIINKEWLSMFNPYELQMLISGELDINIDDLMENTEYGGYSPDDETIKHFWEIVHEMTNEERFQLVKFVTSVPRAPLLGFKVLSPKFGIRNDGAEDLQRLPTSSTCVNLLRLPNYRDKETLRNKLLYAIKAEAGFDLH